MTTISSKRKHHIDECFDSDIKDIDYSNRLFVRLIAKGKNFIKIDFKYSIFDACYLRNCVFDSCDFTGCKFIGVNFYGASFNGCNFNYATFENTIIDDSILDVGCPGWDNLKLKFARSLRINFQQIGDSQAANKAIHIELNATESHLLKAWKSNESYYRKKYSGFNRLKMLVKWLSFKTLGVIWGNGESVKKLLRTVLIIFSAMTLYEVIKFGEVTNIENYWNSFKSMPAIFIGVTSPEKYSTAYITLITFIKLVVMGFFMSIIIKRFNRR